VLTGPTLTPTNVKHTRFQGVGREAARLLHLLLPDVKGSPHVVVLHQDFPNSRVQQLSQPYRLPSRLLQQGGPAAQWMLMHPPLSTPACCLPEVAHTRRLPHPLMSVDEAVRCVCGTGSLLNNRMQQVWQAYPRVSTSEGRKAAAVWS
jgi:hypothetical protein